MTPFVRLNQIGLKELLLIAVGLVTSLGPSSFGQSIATNESQSPSSTSETYTPTMVFDVASVREANPGLEMHRVGGGFGAHSTHLELKNVTLPWLLSIAYNADSHQIVVQPEWAEKTLFDVQAKSDEAADRKLAGLGKEQVKLEQQHMVQILLAERFNLKAHWATREGDIYDLILAKSGSKLLHPGSMPPQGAELKWLGDSKAPPIHQQGDGRLGYEFYGHDCPMETLAAMLGSMMHMNVINETGLSGKYDFHIRYKGNTPSENQEGDPDAWPPLTNALEDQLGLKLKSAKGTVKVLIVDHVEKPAGN